MGKRATVPVEFRSRLGGTKSFRSILEAASIMDVSPKTIRRRLDDGAAIRSRGTTWRVREVEA